jgi:hypothetical protein
VPVAGRELAATVAIACMFVLPMFVLEALAALLTLVRPI